MRPAHTNSRQKIQTLIQTQAWTDATVVGLVLDFAASDPAGSAPLLDYLAHRAEPEAHDGDEGEIDADESEPPEPEPHESVDALEAQFGEIERDPNGDLLTFDDVKGTPPQHIWTIVTGDDGSLWALAGMHLVNRLGYVRLPRPWLTGTEQFRFDA